jgi:dTDP-4-dehydrorhamnose reductase
MIILFGGNGYIGSEFKNQLNKKQIPFINYENARKTTFDQLQTFIKHNKISHVINAAGYTGKPNVDACEINKEETFYGNVLWPQILSNWCALNDIVFGHVSSGCIYTGKRTDGSGFTEEDEPNFTFKQNNCSFYSGTKALAENNISAYPKHYIWRLRIPFEENDNPRNYISKMLKYPKLLQAENSISNKQEFVNACIESIEKNIPFGIYNVVNSGYITTEKLVEKLKLTIAKNKEFNLINDNELYKNYAKTPRSNCVMNNSKLLLSGIKMSNVDESLDWCLKNWKNS